MVMRSIFQIESHAPYTSAIDDRVPVALPVLSFDDVLQFRSNLLRYTLRLGR